MRSAGTCAAAPATSRSSRRCSLPPSARRRKRNEHHRCIPAILPLLFEEGCRRRRRGGRALWSNHPGASRHPSLSKEGKTPRAMTSFRYIGTKRRAKEHPRFVSGRGRFVADIALPGMKHVALVASPHAAARIVSIDTKAALAAPGVLHVLTGEEFCANTDSLAIGVDAPKVTRFALARGVVRYAGEWVAAVVADSRALAEDAAERIEVEYEPLPHVIDPEKALAPGAPLVHPAHGSNVLYHRKFVWGPVEEAFANAEHKIAFRAGWGRSATVPIETFGVAAQWDAGTGILDVWASIQMPKFPDQTARALRLPGNAVRVHHDVDVGGSYGAKRGFGQSPTNFAIERAIDRVARHLGMDRIELRKRNFIRNDQFPYTIPSGSTYDSGDYHAVLDKTLAAIDYASLVRARDEARSSGRLAGIGIASCLEPSGGNSAFEVLMNPKNENTTWMDSCLVRVDLSGAITGVINNSSAGQGHESLVSTVLGEILERDPETIRVVRADSLTALPSNSPVGSRMAIMLGGAAAGAAKTIKETLVAIAAHNFECSPGDLEYRDGGVSLKGAPEKKLDWDQLVEIAHRKFHKLPAGLEPGLQAKFVWGVPTGGALPTPEGRIQIYPCYAFEAHVVLVEIDPDTCKPAIRNYLCGHDCGVMINPDIVHGMTYGGIAHGLGAALYEKFAYTEDGQLASGTFMDYLIPSAMEVPAMAIVDHCTPSPLTTFGQKGSGEAGYLGAPAAIANAVNDALAPLGASIDTLPMSHLAIWNAIGARKGAAST